MQHATSFMAGMHTHFNKKYTRGRHYKVWINRSTEAPYLCIDSDSNIEPAPSHRFPVAKMLTGWIAMGS